jgi:hypothetical protein
MEPSDSPNYVARPPEHERNERLSRLRLNPGDVNTMPLMVKSGQRFVFSADNPMARNWLKPFPDLSTLDDLKCFIGVPDHVFRSNQVLTAPAYPDVHHSSLQAADALDLLDQTSTAYKVAVNLVYGPSPPNAAAHVGVTHLVTAMTGALKGQHLVAGTDLIVDAGAVVDLGPNPTVTFDRIIVHGNGAIICHNHQKVIAGAIQWLPK